MVRTLGNPRATWQRDALRACQKALEGREMMALAINCSNQTLVLVLGVWSAEALSPAAQESRSPS